VERRRAFVRDVRQKLASYRPSASKCSGSSQAQQRSQLFGPKKDRLAHQAAAAALQEENDDFIGGEQLKRALIEREQDEVLDDLGQAVSKLGAMGTSPLLLVCRALSYDRGGREGGVVTATSRYTIAQQI